MPNRINALNDPVNEIDPLGLHGIMLGGRGPWYVNLPRNMRAPYRYTQPRNMPKETFPKPRYVPRPAPNPVKPTKWGKFWKDVADLLGELGLGGFAGTTITPDSDDPCEEGSETPQFTEDEWDECYRLGLCI